MKRLIALLLLLPVLALAGPFDKQLRTDPPRTGRVIASDGTTINQADDIRRSRINIARGLSPGYAPFGSYGERTSVGAESSQPIWPDGSIQFLPPGGVQLSIVSTSANDAAAGSHVQRLEMHYLDRLLDEQHEIITLNGLTPVLTTASDVRWIQCMHVDEYGTTAGASGTITATYGGGIYSQINPGDTRCSSSFRMVPRNKVLYIDGAVGASTSVTADTTTRIRMSATQIDTHVYRDNPPLFIPFASTGLQNNSISFNFPPGIRYDEGALVGCTHTTNKAATVFCSWFGRLEPAQ